MKKVTASVAVVVLLGALAASYWLNVERPGPGKPVEPLPMSYVIDERAASSIAEPTPTPAATVAVPTATQEPTATPSPTSTPTVVPPTPTRMAVPLKPLPTVTVEEMPAIVEPPVLAPAPSLSPVLPPRGVYPSPGVGSTEAEAMEEKTLVYLNWARSRQGIPPYRMNGEMQALAREQALLYVQTRESTGQYPTADKIGAATKARRWFFRDGGGPDLRLWERWTYEEMEQGYTLRYQPFYRNPKGTDIGIAFAFYSGNGVFGSAGGSIVVYVWNGEWDR